MGRVFFLVYEVLVASRQIRMYLGDDAVPIGVEVTTTHRDPYLLKASMLKSIIDFDARKSTLELVPEDCLIRDSCRFV